MKKFLLLISIILITLGSYAQYGIHAVNWPVIEDGVTMISDTEMHNGGNTSAKVSSVEHKAAFRSGKFDVTEGAIFNFSIDIFDDTDDAKLRLYFYLRDVCGNDVWSKSVYSSDTTIWSTLTISDTVPAGAVSGDVKFKVYDDDGIAMYIDNAIYTEDAGDNSFVNSGFEDWADLATPAINCDQQVVSSKRGSYIVASSNAASGKIYLVKENVVITSQTDLEAAETAGDAISGDIVAANTNIEILTTDLALGKYFCYAVDGSGNISEKSGNCVEVAFAYDFLPQNWSTYEEGVTLTREKVIVKERFTSLKITSTERKAALRSERFAVTPGALYSLSMDILDNSVDGKLRAYFYFRDECGNDIVSSNQYSSDSTDWKPLIFADTVPANAVSADIKFKVYDDDENPLYLDNVIYTEDDGDNLFVNSYFEFWENVTTPMANNSIQTVGNASGSFALTSTNAAAGTIYVIEKNLPATTSEELEAAVIAGKGSKTTVTEGDIEIPTVSLAEGTYFTYVIDGYGSVSNTSSACITVVGSYAFVPQFWTIFEPAIEMTREKTIVQERTTSLKVKTTKHKAAFRSGSFVVTPGEAYTLSINVMDTTPDSKLRCYFYFRDSCGVDIVSSSQYSVDSTGWAAIIFTDTVPEGAVTADIKFKVYDSNGNALFVDNVSYIEGAGENIIPNPYFEYWEELVNPWLRNDNATLTNGPDVALAYSSNASTGTAYLIPDTIMDITASSLETLVTELKANKAPVSADPEEMWVPTLQLIPGAYKLILVDEAGNISEEFTSCVDIIEWDNILPIVIADAQTAIINSGELILAQSNEMGFVYIILDGEPATRSAELEAAVLAGKGAKAAIDAINTDMQIMTDSLMAGTYYAYAMDEQFNISEKGENQIELTYATNVYRFEELGLKVYPNPVSYVLNISQAQRVTRYEIINTVGKTIISERNQYSVIQINTSNYSEGIYLLKVYLEDGSSSRMKFIKQ